MTNLQNLREGAVQSAVNGGHNLLDVIRSDKFAAGMQAVATKSLPVDRMVRLCVNAVNRTPKLAECNMQSVLGAMMAAQSLGLEPNTILGHAFLIPYQASRPKLDAQGNIMTEPGGKWIWERCMEVQFQIGYKGFVALFRRSGRVITIDADAIHQNDTFDHAIGSESFFNYQKQLADRGPLVGGFCYTRTVVPGMEKGDFNEASTVLPLEEILKIRESSQTFVKLRDALEKAQTGKNPKAIEKAQAKYDATPWVLWEDVMVAKSAIKRHAKGLDLGDPTLAAAAEIDSSADSGAGDISSFADPDMAKSVIEGQPMPERHSEMSEETFTAPSEKAEPPPPVEEWPKVVADPKTGKNSWADSSGVYFDKDNHAWSKAHGKPSIKSDGTFRDRRKDATKPPPKSKAQPKEPQPHGEESGFSQEGLE